MPAIGQITIYDGQATPVAHVFNPIQTSPAVFKENSAGLPQIGEPEIIATSKLARGADAVNRVKLTLRLPYLEETSGATSGGYVAPPKLAFHDQVTVEFLMPVRSDSSQRKDLRVMLIDLLGEAQVVNMVDDLATLY